MLQHSDTDVQFFEGVSVKPSALVRVCRLADFSSQDTNTDGTVVGRRCRGSEGCQTLTNDCVATTTVGIPLCYLFILRALL
jgi:hypothetical protein